MACFLVPTAEAIVTTAASLILRYREKKAEAPEKSAGAALPETDAKIPFSRKLKWLSNLLWGGSVLLAFEHVWHGEVTPWFPFLTAASDPADTAEMLHEMATAGVSMAVLVTAAWVCMLVVSAVIEKRTPKAQPDVK